MFPTVNSCERFFRFANGFHITQSDCQVIQSIFNFMLVLN